MTCDKCKKGISKRLHTSGISSVKVIVPDISPLDIECNSLYQFAKKTAADLEKDFGNEVSFNVRCTTREYDLCYKCRKDLIKFIEGE